MSETKPKKASSKKRSHNFIDLSSKRIGRWLVIELSHVEKKRTYWKCRCDCGTEALVTGGALRAFWSTSCGCYQRLRASEGSIKHGKAGSFEHRVWKGLHTRCNNPKHHSFKNYGGRGIQVCSSWSNSFEQFLEDMGMAPSNKHSIDRIDNDGNYEPGNCRWSTKREQNKNRRNTVFLSLNGERMCLSDWASKLGMPTVTLWCRIFISKWPIEKALTTPRK